jgi:hypothetical protein
MMNDRFQEMWELQLEFNDKFFLKKLGKRTYELTMEERIEWTKNQLLSIVKESMEVLDEVPNWKTHRNEDSKFVLSNLLEEIVDVNKFSIGLAQIWGMTAEEYFDQYLRKSYVVDQRWQQEQELNLIDPSAKIVGIDVDGVLGEYHDYFVQFAKTRGHAFDDFWELKKALPTIVYEQLKSEYRQSGWKADMPVRKGAVELTHKLKEMGYQIVILTARPYKEYSRIYPDTLSFLNKNDIKFDAIIWDEQKHIKIINKFPNMEFMIEDTPSIARDVAREGYTVFMPKGPNNELGDFGLHPKIVEVDDLLQIFKYLP